MNNDAHDDVLFLETLISIQTILAPICQSHSKVFILCDENTLEACFPLLAENCAELKDAELIVIEPGESSKSLDIAHHIFLQLIESEADKNSLLINLGGGVVTDLGGWIACNYKRGITFIHIPTSLMAMTDAALGGKNGLNLGEYKNMIGTIHFARHTLVCAEFLESLPKPEIQSGRAEMVKHALLTDMPFYERCIESIDANKPIALDEIRNSAAIKLRIVEQDPYELNRRKILNFGHTVGHALESWFLSNEQPIAHGIAVAAGMAIEINIGDQIGLSQTIPSNQIAKELIFSFDLYDYNWPTFEMWSAYLFQDKKNTAGQIKMALLKHIGECEINVHVTLPQIQEAYLSFLEMVAE